MNLIPILSTAMFIAAVASAILAVGGYVAYRARARRRPNRRSRPEVAEEAIFFRRYHKRTGTHG